MSLEFIVRTYKTKIRPRAQSELEWFQKPKKLREAVEKAATATNSKEKRFSHQRRLKKTSLEESRRILLANLDPIRECASFDELHSLLDFLVRPINGIGELYVYDTALRIGANLNLFPTKVYLHAGTRIGATQLGFKGKESTIVVSRFPKELQELEPHEIEDALCIFKDLLGKDEVLSFDKDIFERSWCC